MYIHYGHDQFDKNKFEPIKNRKEMVKPLGGLWASREDSDSGWKNWVEENEMTWARLDTSFRFEIKKDAKVLLIDNVEQLKELPKQTSILEYSPWILLDFEKLSEQYDAIEVILDRRLYFELYGWDCDSIIIMNPDVIIPE